MDINDIKKQKFTRDDLESIALNYFELCEELHKKGVPKKGKIWDLVYSHYAPFN